MSATQVLASWNDGGTKEAILAFVRSITTPGDNDGTLWCEKPTYVQADFILYHDDGEREFAYDVGAERALAAARQQGWTVVSMKRDFATMFAAEEAS